MFLKARVAALLAAALAALAPALAAGEPATRPSTVLTQAGAEAALQAAERLARQANDPAAIAVVDTDGLLLAFIRMDGARPGSVDLAIGKARSAALMQRPTAELEANVATGRVGLATAGLTALGGGAPLKIGAETVGAIGIAGLKKEDDVANSAAVAAGFPASAH
jgi:glc operon protein GlcG